MFSTPNKRINVTGGEYHRSHVTQYNVSDGTATRLANMEEGRYDHGCALIKNETMLSVMVAGGYDRSGNALESAALFDLTTATWSLAGQLNTGRHGTRMTTLPNSRVVVIGGWGGGSAPKYVEEYLKINHMSIH